MVRKQLLIKGYVQGVGFRFYCKFIAHRLGLTGFAENIPNGNVLIEVQGSETDIFTFLSELYKGNGFCNVSDICCEDVKVKLNEHNFNMY